MATAVAAGRMDGPASRPAMAGFAGFLQLLREPDLPPVVISPRRFCEVLSIDLQTLADLAHVHRNTVQRSPASPLLQAYLRDALRVIRAASDQQAPIESALFWFRNEPLPDFDFQTPERVVSALGADALLRAMRPPPP